MKKLDIINFIVYKEAWEILIFIKKSMIIQENQCYYPDLATNWEHSQVLNIKYALYNSILINEHPLIICMPPKTADITLKNTFNKNNIKFNGHYHKPQIFDKNLYSKICKKIRFIIGLREPINQNLSLLYEQLGNIGYLSPKLWLDIKILQPDGDVQLLFDQLLSAYINIKNEPTFNIKNFLSLFIQNFIPEYCKYIADIMKEPFDKEKGYTIIQDGNVEVFVYQLEKLNDNVQALSEWVGVPFDTLVNGNVAADKWIADSYKQAQKEIKISQEFFDKCFNEPYVKHFYSDEDIEKFKERWRPHIR
ncbi:hypothetical protein AN641_08345 [Candidatus Epulonipiscioides gigas]|nr:hypothetical protein AN641_08345 [Epulopiscium sp. SCG-C07WGA-EpuloA2]